MATSLVFNNVYSSNSQKYTNLLNLICIHPSFKSKVNQFYQILNLSLSQQSIKKLGALAFTFLLPYYPQKYVKILSQQLFQSIKTHDNKITYSNLTQYLLKLCSMTIQNIDIRSAIAFLDILKSRITDTFIVNVQDPSKRKRISNQVKLQIIDTENVMNESGLLQKFHRSQMKHLYFQQKISLSEQNLLDLTETQVLITELKNKLQDVIPLGYISQDFLYHFTNSDFQTKNSYRLRKCKKINIQKVDYFITISENSKNFIRDLTVNQEIFYSIPVITLNHLPQQISPNIGKVIPIFRFNQTFATRNYLQRLKQLNSSQSKFYNILSQFFDRDQFNIDELNLTRQKLIVRRKQNLLGISGKQTIKKQERDYNYQINNLGLLISKNLNKFYDQNRSNNHIKELQTGLRLIQQQDKNINTVLQKHLTQQTKILKDSQNPFLEDILNYAKLVPLQLLIIGRPKSGKTSLAKAVAKFYNLIYISVQSMVQKVFERSKFFQQNPPQVDEDGNAKDGLLAIQKYILSEIQKGNAVQQQDILDLINIELQKQITQSRGFILDLPFQYNKYWFDTLISNRIVLPKIQCRFFTHIIQIQQTEEQWKYFTSSIMEKPQDLSLSSKLERYILKKPKPPLEQGQEEQANQEKQPPQPLIQSNLIEVKWKQSGFSLIQHLTQHINPHNYLKIQNSYQSVQQCLSLLQFYLYKIPLPKKIEGNQKQLLGVGLEQAKIFRKWSPWGLTDCVELSRQKLINGKFQFAAQYAGRVFVFQNQNNLNAFLNLPRKYLKQLPKIPKLTNICITGPRKSGKKTLAKILSQIYNLKIINIQQILQQILMKQKQFQNHIPSNFDKRSSSIHLSQGQFKQFSKGQILNAKSVLPIILYKLGINLQKKPPGWGIQKNEQGTGQNNEPQVSKPAPKKAKKKDKNAQQQRPKTPPPQDLVLDDIIPEINHFGKLNEIKGYIIIGYPNNQQQLNALKNFNIPIDKLIILSDNSQQNPNKTLKTRLNDAQLQQVSLFSAAIGPVKQALGEEVCKQIMIDKTPQQIINKIRQIIDPYYIKPDEDNINRVCADKQEDGDPIPLGFSGQFCPVTLKNGWIMKGKQQFQSGIQGKRYKFCGQKQINQFKTQPQKYLSNQIPIIPPRIMFMGIRGVGLKTQLLKLNQKYRIPILTLKQTLLQQLQNQKNKRKTQRYYNKGFKKPQFDQEGKQLQDPQILQQAADFDKKANEIEVIKKIFSDMNQIFINGNFYDVEQDKVSTNIIQLLGQARKLPQLVLLLTSDQPKWLQRVLDRKAIQKQLQVMKQKRRIQKQKQKQQARKKALQAGQQYNEPAEQQDTQIPKLQQLIAQRQQSLKAQRQADNTKIQQYAQTFKSWGVQVVNIKCERQAKHVTDRINYVIKPYIQQRINRWQKNNMLSIDRLRVKDFINNYIASQSRFKKLNPYSLIQNPKPYPLIFKDRIYYFKDQQQRQFALRNPKSLQQNQAIPNDVKLTPVVFITGKTKTGKSTLAESISKSYGFKIISLQQIIQQFSKQHEDIDIKLIINDVKNGKCLSDEAIVLLIQKRVSMFDCMKGWILDGLPLNKKQCQLLNKKGIVPSVVIALRMTQLQIKKRVMAKQKQLKNNYDYYLEVIHNRLEATRNNLVDIQVYYDSKYNNLKTIDANLSKWGIFQQTKKQIQERIKAKRLFIKDLAKQNATDVSKIGLSSNCVLQNLSQYNNYCPISYKIRRQYIKVCIKNYQNLALFNRKIYTFKGQKQLKDFIANPDTFTSKGGNFIPPQSINLEDIAAFATKAENKGYCMVELYRKKLVTGNTLFALKYKQKIYLTSIVKNSKLFHKNPSLYQLLKLPDKLPVQFQKKSDLKKIAKRNDCSAFLEHHLSNIMMKCLAQLGYRRPKYPTIGSKQSALKFLSLSLKANNPNKDDEYRTKYNEKLNKFIKECNYSQQIRQQLEKKEKGNWQQQDQQNLLKLCEQYNNFMKQLESTQKTKYFSSFIR